MATVPEYLASLPADRREAITAVRKAINDSLPDGYEEGMQFGMISWYVSLSMYPAGYGDNPKVPVPLVSLGSQKSGMVLHCIALYMNPTLSDWFVNEYKKSGKKLDMGKGCVRFKKLDDLALDVVVRTVARVPVAEHTSPITKRREQNRAREQRARRNNSGFTTEITEHTEGSTEVNNPVAKRQSTDRALFRMH